MGKRFRLRKNDKIFNLKIRIKKDRFLNGLFLCIINYFVKNNLNLLAFLLQVHLKILSQLGQKHLPLPLQATSVPQFGHIQEVTPILLSLLQMHFLPSWQPQLHIPSQAIAILVHKAKVITSADNNFFIFSPLYCFL